VELAAALPSGIASAVATLDPFDPALVVAGHTGDAAAGDQVLLDVLQGLVRSARAVNSRRANSADWRRFVAWCQHRGPAALPAIPLTGQAKACPDNPRGASSITRPARSPIGCLYGFRGLTGWRR